MNNLDYSLRQDSEEAFVLNAKYLCGMSREDAVIKWRNFHMSFVNPARGSKEAACSSALLHQQCRMP